MLDITDPFGKYRRKELEFDNRQLVERNQQLEADAKEHRKLDEFLVESLNASYAELSAKTRELLAIRSAYVASEEARKSLGEKNKKLSAENELLTAKLGELCKEISDLKTQTMEATA